jgi:hypothetical protein
VPNIVVASGSKYASLIIVSMEKAHTNRLEDRGWKFNGEKVVDVRVMC